MPTLPSIINPPVGAAVVSYPLPKLPLPLTDNFDPGAVSPMPTLPSIINPPVGAAVVSYPLPKLPPPLTLNIDPGAVSPMPTRPLLKMDKAFTLVADALREIKSSRWANSDPASRSSILNFAASPWAVALPSPPAAEPVPVKYPQLPNAREPAIDRKNTRLNSSHSSISYA